jgi:LPXTG-site transpeptidase (sortase) family protein
MMPRILKAGHVQRDTLLLWLERLLLAVGVICLGIVVFAWIDARWFAFQQGRRLDRALRERAAVAAAGRSGGTAGTVAPHAAPGASGGGLENGGAASDTDRLDTFHPGGGAVAPRPPAAPEGSLLGRVEIPRVGISALLLEGLSGSTLRRGVGHVPGTSLPELAGNVGVAGHRDTVFRGLKDIRKGDVVQLDTLAGTYRYTVDWAQVVDPSDVGVLARSSRRELTLVTCYPFYYVGSAPERFVVRAHLLDDSGAAGMAAGPIVPEPR